MQCFYAVVPDGSNTVGQWHMMSPWSVDLVAQELLPWALHKFSGHVRTLELPNLWVPTLRKTWGKKRTSETSMFSIYFSITCGWNMTWPTVDSSSQRHLHLTNMESLNLLIMWWSWLHAQEDLLTAPFRHAAMLVKGTNGYPMIPMLLVRGGQISWCNHVEVVRNHSYSQTAKNFYFNMFWGSWLLTVACHFLGGGPHNPISFGGDLTRQHD